jgi:hypothetical protein
LPLQELLEYFSLVIAAVEYALNWKKTYQIESGDTWPFSNFSTESKPNRLIGWMLQVQVTTSCQVLCCLTWSIHTKDSSTHCTFYRVSHQTMSISIPEPSHGPQMWAIFRSQSTRKQSYRKYLIQSSCLPLKLAFDLTRHQICPFRIVSKMDQRSIIFDLHLKGLSVHAIHDALVATLGLKAVAHNTVTR